MEKKEDNESGEERRQLVEKKEDNEWRRRKTVSGEEGRQRMEKEDNEWRRRDEDNDNHYEDSEVNIIVCG